MSTANRPHEPGTDYADRYSAVRPARDDRTAEAWMRAVLEDPPAPVRAFLLFGWRVALGFRPGPRPSAAHVLGWPIAENDAGHVVLRQRSALMTADLSLWVTADALVWTTRVRHLHPAAGAVWAVVRLVHVLTVPRLLRQAVRRR